MTTPVPHSPKRRRLNLLRHPSDRGEGRGRFDHSAEAVSNFASTGLFFSICFIILATWIVGLIAGFASGTENALTGVMSALTLLLVALLKNSEQRAERAMQLKLDAIATALMENRGTGLGQEANDALEEAVGIHEEI